MNCSEIQNLLLSADDLAAHGAAAEHLAGCEDCRQVAEDVRQWELSGRALPLPAAADASKSRFLARLATENLPNIAAQEHPAPAETASSERVRIRKQPAA